MLCLFDSIEVEVWVILVDFICNLGVSFVCSVFEFLHREDCGWDDYLGDASVWFGFDGSGDVGSVTWTICIFDSLSIILTKHDDCNTVWKDFSKWAGYNSIGYQKPFHYQGTSQMHVHSLLPVLHLRSCFYESTITFSLESTMRKIKISRTRTAFNRG